MILCPACRSPYHPSRSERQDLWRCPFCCGELISLGLLKKLVGEAPLRVLLSLPEKATIRFLTRNCPYCRGFMPTLPVSSSPNSISLELCRSCEVVWLDGGELVRLARNHRLRKLAAAPAHGNPSAELIVSEGEKLNIVLESILGLQDIESEEKAKVSAPYATYTLIAVCLLVFGAAARDLSTATVQYGFEVSRSFRHFGLTWLTSQFLHADLAHLFGNLFFLFLFGGAAELKFGPLMLAELFLLSGLGGNLAILFSAPPTPRSVSDQAVHYWAL